MKTVVGQSEVSTGKAEVQVKADLPAQENRRPQILKRGQSEPRIGTDVRLGKDTCGY